MKKRVISRLACTLSICTLLGGCGSASRDATEAAINAAQTAIYASRAAAQQYAPEQIKAAQDAVDEARHALAKNDYTAALNGAREAAQRAREAVTAASARKEEWTKSWESLSASAPKLMNEIQIKMDAYAKYGRLPKGVDNAQMEAARTQYEKLKQEWAETTSAHKNGNWIETMKKTSDFKDGLQKVREALGLTQ